MLDIILAIVVCAFALVSCVLVAYFEHLWHTRLWFAMPNCVYLVVEYLYCKYKDFVHRPMNIVKIVFDEYGSVDYETDKATGVFDTEFPEFYYFWGFDKDEHMRKFYSIKLMFEDVEYADIDGYGCHLRLTDDKDVESFCKENHICLKWFNWCRYKYWDFEDMYSEYIIDDSYAVWERELSEAFERENNLKMHIRYVFLSIWCIKNIFTFCEREEKENDDYALALMEAEVELGLRQRKGIYVHRMFKPDKPLMDYDIDCDNHKDGIKSKLLYDNFYTLYDMSKDDGPGNGRRWKARVGTKGNRRGKQLNIVIRSARRNKNNMRDSFYNEYESLVLN